MAWPDLPTELVKGLELAEQEAPWAVKLYSLMVHEAVSPSRRLVMLRLVAVKLDSCWAVAGGT